MASSADRRPGRRGQRRATAPARSPRPRRRAARGWSPGRCTSGTPAAAPQPSAAQRRHQVLAVVEHQQRPAIAEVARQRLPAAAGPGSSRRPSARSHGRGDQLAGRSAAPARPTRRRPDSVHHVARPPAAPGASCRMPPGAGEGQQAGLAEQLADLGELVLPADEARQLHGQVVGERVQRPQRRELLGRSGWTSCQTRSGRAEVACSRWVPRSQQARPRARRSPTSVGGRARTRAPVRHGRTPGGGRSGSAPARRSCRRRAAAPRRCARPCGPGARPRRARARRPSRAGRRAPPARASEARLNTATTLSPSPCSTGRAPAVRRRRLVEDLVVARQGRRASPRGRAPTAAVEPSTSVSRKVTVPAGRPASLPTSSIIAQGPPRPPRSARPRRRREVEGGDLDDAAARVAVHPDGAVVEAVPVLDAHLAEDGDGPVQGTRRHRAAPG